MTLNIGALRDLSPYVKPVFLNAMDRQTSEGGDTGDSFDRIFPTLQSSLMVTLLTHVLIQTGSQFDLSITIEDSPDEVIWTPIADTVVFSFVGPIDDDKILNRGTVDLVPLNRYVRSILFVEFVSEVSNPNRLDRVVLGQFVGEIIPNV